MPIDRSSIAKIESGKRGVSLDELFWFAVALDVSPMALCVPRDGVELQVAPTVAAFGWEGPEVTTVQLLDELPGSLFLPLSSTEVAALDPPAGTVTRVGFETAADGAPKALVVHAAGGDVRAVRATE